MATRILAFSTYEPTPDVSKLYWENVADHEPDETSDECCLSFDEGEYILSGFNKRHFAVKNEKTSHKGLLARLFMRKCTVSVPLEDALTSSYIPDALVLEDGSMLESSETPNWEHEYRKVLALSGSNFVTFAINHT